MGMDVGQQLSDDLVVVAVLQCGTDVCYGEILLATARGPQANPHRPGGLLLFAVAKPTRARSPFQEPSPALRASRPALRTGRRWVQRRWRAAPRQCSYLSPPPS